MPNDPISMAGKAGVYLTDGNLQEADRLLSGINEASPFDAFLIKMMQLRLERNYGEAVRLSQARLAQFHYATEYDKAFDQVTLAFMQRLAGDTIGAKVTAEQARNTLDKLLKDQPDTLYILGSMSRAYAAMGEKELALKEAERAMVMWSPVLNPR